VISDDQSGYQDDEAPYTPIAPSPMSPTGSVPPGSYATETWSEQDTNTDDGISVVSSTSAGTYALTGAVFNQAGDPIPGATVTAVRYLNPLVMVNPDGEPPQVPVNAMTDAAGGFAFINMPGPTPRYFVKLTVSAQGYGSFEYTKYPVSGDETYQSTIELGSTNRTRVGLSTVAADRPAIDESTLDRSIIGYVSRRHPPPTIKVAEYPFNDVDCKRIPGSTYAQPIKTYKWRYYVLTTLLREVGGSAYPGGAFQQQAVKAVGMSIHQFAWHFRILRGGGLAHGGADIDNTVDSFQCFDRDNPLPSSYYRNFTAWYEDILNERVINTDPNNYGRIPLLQHSSGLYRCEEPAGSYHAENSNRLSQLGAKAKTELSGNRCVGNADGAWRDILDYYLSSQRQIVSIQRPPAPRASYTTGPGVIHFDFVSRVADGQNRRTAVGFQYYLLRKPQGGSRWAIVRRIRGGRRVGEVPTSLDFPTSGCAQYQVAGSNPAGLSQYSPFTATPGATTPSMICV
jgi:hypothetical protein